MSTILQPLVSGLLALFGVLVGGIATHRFAVSRERESRRTTLSAGTIALRREKGEELYTLISQWSRTLLANCIPFLMVMQGKLSVNDAMDLNSKNLPPSSFDFERIEMIIDVYFADIRPLYEQCIEQRTLLNKVFAEFDSSVRASVGSLDRYIEPYVQAQDGFEMSSEELKKAVRGELRRFIAS